MKASQELKEFVDDLIAEANDVAATRQGGEWGSWIGDNEKLQRFAASCRLLVAKLGSFGAVWDQMLQVPPNTNLEFFETMRGALGSIQAAMAKGRLSTVEQLVSADVLGDLLEHAEELLKSNYRLAAAIVLRAVLEERLRKLCEANNCLPTNARPTIESFKQSLYSAQVIDKLILKDIDWMAAVGNAAAHHLKEYKDDDVPLLYERMVTFLSRFSVR